MEKKLYKSNTNKIFDGVCGGVAEYFNIDATLVRLIWVLIALTGSGILAYIVCMVIMPRNPGAAPPASDNGDNGQQRNN